MFTKAIVRKPGKNFSSGITTANLGEPDFEKALIQHSNYVDALKSCALKIISLDADDKFPDGCFVEDTAIITEKIAVITNPGVASRKGEQDSIAEVLKEFRELLYIKSPGTLEGGDVVKAENHYYIGLSERTNEEGARQLGAILSDFGFTSTVVPPGNILHLKTGMNYIGDNMMIAVKELAGYDIFKEFEIIELQPLENYAANCIRVGSKLIIAAGYPVIKSGLEKLKYEIIALEVSEFEKMDGGLSCLSLIF
jgi:dimethylargininase